MSVGKKQKNCDRTTRQAVWLFFHRVLCQAKKRQNNRRPEKSDAEQNHDRHGEERTCLAGVFLIVSRFFSGQLNRIC